MPEGHAAIESEKDRRENHKREPMKNGKEDCRNVEILLKKKKY